MIPDRAQLEAERLARNVARQQAELSNRNTLEPGECPSPAAGPSAPTSVSPPTTQPSTSAEPSTKSGYWKAQIKLTYNQWHEDTSNAVRAEDIIGPVEFDMTHL